MLQEGLTPMARARSTPTRFILTVSPLPPHTYGYVQYDPVGNDYLLLKGQLELGPDVKATPISHMFNLDSLTWRRGPKHPLAVLSSGGWTTWDASRRILWGHSGENGNGFIGFTPDGDNGDGTFGSWTTLYPKKVQSSRSQYDGDRPSARYYRRDCQRRKCALCARPECAGGRTRAAFMFGDQPVLAEFAALEYAPNLHRFVYFSAKNGPRLYSITEPDGSSWPQLTNGAWKWSCILNADNRLDPIAHAATNTRHDLNRDHTFGRFRVATYGIFDLAVLIRHVDTPVYAMMLN